MLKRPLAIFALLFCLGIFVAGQIKVPFWLIYVVALIFLFLGVLSLKKGLRFDLFCCCLVFLFAAGLLKNTRILPKSHIARFVSYKSNYLYTVKGFVDNQPALQNNRTSFIFRVQEIQFAGLKYKSCGRVLVRIKGRKIFAYGEGLILKGYLHRPFALRNTKRQSYRDYLYNQGIFFLMPVNAPPIRLNQNKGNVLKRLAFGLKERTEDIISGHLSYVPAGILEAMVLGEKRNISPVIYNSMIKSGTVHILVVSGFNVGIVASIIILLLKLIRIPRRTRFYFAVPLLILYCLMTGASTPVIRATVMAIVFMFAYLVKREPDIYNSCALAALFILGSNPGQLFDAGFQLSFVSVLSIVYFYPRMKALLRLDALKIKYIRFLIEGCLVSLSAWLGTVGLIACYFRIISPVTVLANLFIVPLASLVTLCGFSLIVMQLTCPVLVPLFARSTESVAMLLLGINTFLIKLPLAYVSLP
jgi:competence protein ComEC